MRILRCDQCGAEAPQTNPYDDPLDWLIVKQGAEDDATLCTMGCLATWAALQSIDQEAL